MSTIESMTDRHQAPAYPLRLPPDLKEQVVIAAKETGRSFNAEVAARLQASFDGGASDAQVTELQHRLAAMETERELMKETARHMESLIDARGLTIMMLQTYLIDVINGLPKKLQSEDRFKIAARFALSLDRDDAGHVQTSIPLDTSNHDSEKSTEHQPGRK